MAPRAIETDLTDGSSHWFELTDRSGKTVAVCVTRTIELTRGTTLLEYLKAHFERVQLDTPDEMPEIGDANHEVLSNITGRFCQSGDLSIDRSYRRGVSADGRELAGDPAKLQLLMAYLDFDPDHIFCFVKMPLIIDDFAARCGCEDCCRSYAGFWIGRARRTGGIATGIKHWYRERAIIEKSRSAR